MNEPTDADRACDLAAELARLEDLFQAGEFAPIFGIAQAALRRALAAEAEVARRAEKKEP